MENKLKNMQTQRTKSIIKGENPNRSEVQEDEENKRECKKHKAKDTKDLNNKKY